MPVNDGSGLNVTVPSGFTVYVPSPGTVTDVLVQLGAVSAVTGGVAAASARPHNFTDESTHSAPGVSFVRTGMT